MIRDVGQLARETFDVLVIGGGIHGLTTAYEAAQRGLRVALVERRDFGAATTFNHHKTLHGGLRYLQTADIQRMRESIGERRAFARIAPQLISPQAFVTPTWPRLARSAMALRAAFVLDQLLAYDRNAGVPPSHQLPPGRVLTRDELLALVPDARQLPITGGAIWYDYRTDEGDRLTLAFALASARFGAVLANYIDAVEPLRQHGRIVGMKVRDTVSGSLVEIRAHATVNAAGASVGRIMAAFGARRVFPLLKAMNVVTRRTASGPAVALPSAGGRLLVALPWRGRLTVGTSHGDQLCGADDTRVNTDEVSAFLDEVNAAFPWLSIGLDEVSIVHRGVVPAMLRPGAPPALLDRAEVRDHAQDGIEGAVSIVGVKYTTARRLAERTVDLVALKLRRTVAPSRTSKLPLLAPLRSEDAAPPKPVDSGPAERITRVYGATAARVLGLHAEQPEHGRPLAEGVPVTGAQVLEAVRYEMALTLEDVVVRRTGLGAAGYPGDAVVRACAAIVQQELGWDSERVEQEVAGVQRFYDIPTSEPAAAHDRL
jgi:glycerol-3-phosphate dehydrogenase